MVLPLDDITVVEIDNWMASPSAGALLSDMGADVIKIEPLTGDPMRAMGRAAKVDGPAASYDFGFDVDNRGKRSIAVALDTPEGVDIVHRLVAKADIFMCNLLPVRQQKFGVSPDQLSKINSRLVHATLTGYGTSGPDAWRPGYDVTAFFGRSGLYDAMRSGIDGEVPMARPAQGDHTTGLAFLAAILSALRLAERTGEGQTVETSLYEAAIWTQATDFAVTAVDKAPVRKRARNNALIPLGNRYPCGDGNWVVFNMPEPSPWGKFCSAIGRPEWIDDQRYATPKARYAHMHELVAGIDDALSARTRDEWGEIFDAEGFIWGPVLGLHEVAADPQAHAIGLFPTIEHPAFGAYRSVHGPLRIQGVDISPKAPAPKMGEHSTEVLQAAGFTAVEIEQLIARGAVSKG